MGRLFGTDGIRGIANTEIGCELALKIGRAAATVLTENKENKRLKLLIGTDTRKSADMLTAALASGICSVGCDAVLAGVVPTPAVAFLVKEYSYDAGVMISASHNPCEYNGIKIFRSDGYKLPDETEERIEAIILDEIASPSLKIGGDVGSITFLSDAVERYVQHIKSAAAFRLDGLKIAIDCANGSASVTAEKLFTELGAECTVIGNEPDGVNINADCGSTHIETLGEFVKGKGFDIGFAFDGDADRLMAVSSSGRIFDGDMIIYMLAKYMKSKGLLRFDTVVGTSHTNMAIERALGALGIRFIRTDIGDKYVLSKLVEKNLSLGGEQSGHIILKDLHSTGDGILSAIAVANMLCECDRGLDELFDVTLYPQTNINVLVKDKFKIVNSLALAKETAHIQNEISESGRVMVRASGTEPKIRIMVESECENANQRYANSLVSLVKEIDERE